MQRIRSLSSSMSRKAELIDEKNSVLLQQKIAEQEHQLIQLQLTMNSQQEKINKLEATFAAKFTDEKVLIVNDQIACYKSSLELYISCCQSTQSKWIGGMSGAFIKAGLSFVMAAGCITAGFTGPAGWVLGGICLLGALHCVRKARKENKKIELLTSINRHLCELEPDERNTETKADSKLNDLQFISNVRSYVDNLVKRCDASSVSMKCLEEIEKVLKSSAGILVLKSKFNTEVGKLIETELKPKGFKLFNSIDFQFTSRANDFLRKIKPMPDTLAPVSIKSFRSRHQ